LAKLHNSKNRVGRWRVSSSLALSALVGTMALVALPPNEAAAGLGDLVKDTTDSVGLGGVGSAVDDVVDDVADTVDDVGDTLGDTVNTVTGGTGGDTIDDVVDGAADLLGGTNGGSNGGLNGGVNGGATDGLNGGSAGSPNGNTNRSGGLFGLGGFNCETFGNSANYSGMSAVDQNNVAVGNVVGAQINGNLDIQAVRIETTAEINGARRCLTIRGGQITVSGDNVVLPVDQAQLVQATMD